MPKGSGEELFPVEAKMDEELVLLTGDTKANAEDAVDIVDLTAKRPVLYRGILGMVVAWGLGTTLLFVAALGVSKKSPIPESHDLFQMLDGHVSCKDGVPKTITLVVAVFLLAFAAFELNVFLSTAGGKQTWKAKRATVVVLLGVGTVCRWDVYSDIVFAVTADRCKSSVATWSFILFGVGVLLLQIIPGILVLLIQGPTHLSLKMNDLCLLMDAIDPTRGELELPKKMESIALGELSKGNKQKDQAVVPTGAIVQRTPEEIAAIKGEIQTLTELEKLQEQDDPDNAKKQALISHAKAVGGAMRFFFEDVWSAYLQIKFLYEQQDNLSFWTKIFVLGSVVANVMVSLGGPVHAFVKERESRRYYASLPKLQGGEKWAGIITGDGGDEGCKFQWWDKYEMTFTQVERGFGSAAPIHVKGKVRQTALLKEVDGRTEYEADMPRHYRNWLAVLETLEKTFEGEYDIKHSTLRLKDTLNEGDDPERNMYTYDLKVYPDRLVGTALRQSGAYTDPILLTFKRLSGDLSDEP